jgi:hypothetical protein
VNSGIWVALIVAFVVVAAIVMLWVRRRRRGTDAVAAIRVKSMRDVVLPDGMGGQIHLEHVLLTARGIVVLDVKNYDGTVFASDRMDEWTVIGKAQRFTFPNPQRALFDRVAAIKAVSRDIPVNGFILFCGEAEFGKDRPSDAILPAELIERFRKPDSADLERLMDAFMPHWDKVVNASEPAPRVTSRV